MDSAISYRASVIFQVDSPANSYYDVFTHSPHPIVKLNYHPNPNPYSPPSILVDSIRG